MFKIFDESPTPRDVYLKEGTSFQVPVYFSTEQDVQVAERTLEVWDSVVVTVKF